MHHHQRPRQAWADVPQDPKKEPQVSIDSTSTLAWVSMSVAKVKRDEESIHFLNSVMIGM
jgi:hypothetical protein